MRNLFPDPADRLVVVACLLGAAALALILNIGG